MSPARDQSRQNTSHGDYQPPLYVDVEGKVLAIMEVPLLAVLVYPGKGLERPDIIDIHTLGGVAFWTVGVLGMSLKDILESPEIVKDFMTCEMIRMRSKLITASNYKALEILS
ncbi:hypothetical protein FPOA_06890 [Fusarium poae]|uniref:Uncharacterized protein n=1 Tax=Fusarium poae TaxID=36050 RepID=A0A1B8AJ85_FUSPO|nr:hypothetical protein FPOA_06890 [Fusarium poae]